MCQKIISKCSEKNKTRLKNSVFSKNPREGHRDRRWSLEHASSTESPMNTRSLVWREVAAHLQKKVAASKEGGGRTEVSGQSSFRPGKRELTRQNWVYRSA